MSTKFVISGKTFTKGINGMPRYAAEIIKRLDELIVDEDIELAMPGNCSFKYQLKKIKIVKLENICKLWGLRCLNKYVKKQKAIEINFANGSCLQKSIVCLHDVIPLQFKTKLTKKSLMDKIATRFWLGVIRRHAISVVTVSEFSKAQISKYFKKTPINVIGNGYEHVLGLEGDDNIFEKFPKITRGEYYFTLGNVSPHKNTDWVFENAKLFPENTYVLAGKISAIYSDDIEAKAYNNVVYVGYVSDGEMIALMKNAKALLFPTFIEGFGIPPIEALAMGIPAICSDIPCLKEIYGGSVYYIDPHDPSSNLGKLLEGSVQPPESVFEKHNWDKSAKQWYEVIKSYNKP